LLSLTGHSPNLDTVVGGHKLKPDKTYDFNLEQMCFVESSNGSLSANHIKFLRLAFTNHRPKTLAQVHGGTDLAANLQRLVAAMLQAHVPEYNLLV
jgi:hypothetical protein